MDAVMTAIARGDYPKAYELLQQTAEAQTQNGRAIGALLLALVERFDEAAQLVAAAEAPALRVIVDGERQRATRWRDPEANGSLRATEATELIPLYCAVATAFVRDNLDLASRAKARMLEIAQPVTGTLTFIDGQTHAFRDLTDVDDAIGQMLETYCGDGLLYFPFASLRRVEVLPRTSLLDHLLPRVKITDEHGTAQAYVPLLYAGSATSEITQVRTGEATLTLNLGPAKRGAGQRGLYVDGGDKLVGFHRVAAIDFAPRAEAPTGETAPPSGETAPP